MVIRELEAEEYHRLEGHPMLDKMGVPNPDYSRIVIAEEGDSIVGFWTMVQVVHMEPIWIAPEYRGGTIAGRMWAKIKQVLDDNRIKSSYSFSETSAISDYLGRLGMKELPYKVHMYKADS